jgi:hypothetical protein
VGIAGESAPRRPFYNNPASGGFACILWVFLSVLALCLHEFRLHGDAGRALTQWIGGLALCCAPFFPWFLLASPVPANGAKLIIFSAASSVALAPWIPPRWTSDAESRALFVRYVLAGSVLFNALILATPARGRIIQWGAGGKPMAVVALLAVAFAAVDGLLPQGSPSTTSYRFAGVVLFVIFIFFLVSRFTVSPIATLGAVILASAASAAVLRADSRPAVQQVADSAVVAFALMGASLYCWSHVAKSGSTVWAFTGILAMQGCVAAMPGLAIPLAAGLATFAIAAFSLRQGAGAALLLLSAGVLGFVASITWDPFRFWRDRIPADPHVPQGSALFLASAVGGTVLALVAVLRMRRNAAALAAASCAAACLALGMEVPTIDHIYYSAAAALAAALAATLAAPRASLVPSPAEEAASLR